MVYLAKGTLKQIHAHATPNKTSAWQFELSLV